MGTFFASCLLVRKGETKHQKSSGRSTFFSPTTLDAYSSEEDGCKWVKTRSQKFLAETRSPSFTTPRPSSFHPNLPFPPIIIFLLSISSLVSLLFNCFILLALPPPLPTFLPHYPLQRHCAGLLFSLPLPPPPAYPCPHGRELFRHRC